MNDTQELQEVIVATTPEEALFGQPVEVAYPLNEPPVLEKGYRLVAQASAPRPSISIHLEVDTSQFNAGARRAAQVIQDYISAAVGGNPHGLSETERRGALVRHIQAGVSNRDLWEQAQQQYAVYRLAGPVAWCTPSRHTLTAGESERFRFGHFGRNRR